MSGLHSPHWCRFFPGLLRTWLTTFLLGPSLISIIVKQSTSLSNLSYTLYLVMTNKEQCCNIVGYSACITMVLQPKVIRT